MGNISAYTIEDVAVAVVSEYVDFIKRHYGSLDEMMNAYEENDDDFDEELFRFVDDKKSLVVVITTRGVNNIEDCEFSTHKYLLTMLSLFMMYQFMFSNLSGAIFLIRFSIIVLASTWFGLFDVLSSTL